MGSSGGGSGGAGMAALMGQGRPMPGLPIAGQGTSSIGDPYEYGKFQNFLPDIQAEGENPMATGLRPDMFKYRSPSGVVAEGSGGAGGGDNVAGQIQGLRDELAKLTGGGGGGNPPYGYNPFDQTSPGYSGQGWGGGGGGGTMGMGAGGGGGGMPNEAPTYGFNGSTERMPVFWGTGVRYAAQPPGGNNMPSNPFPAGTPGS